MNNNYIKKLTYQIKLLTLILIIIALDRITTYTKIILIILLGGYSIWTIRAFYLDLKKEEYKIHMWELAAILLLLIAIIGGLLPNFVTKLF